MSSKFTWNFKNIKNVIFILIILIGVMAIGNFTNKTQKYEIANGKAKNQDVIAEEFGEETLPENSVEPESISEASDKKEVIFVDIAGEVENPSVVEVDGGERLQKAVELAGGLTDFADRDAVNLAQKLIDGAQYIIPSKGEKLVINYQEGIGFSEDKDAGRSDSGKLNINTASKEQLMELSGVGAVISQRILDYRNENGQFKAIEDLKDVSGIGDKKFNDIKNSICIN
ncbi:MAG: helix-hairpin-helix domain-containing protein [Proteocatella sp.]